MIEKFGCSCQVKNKDIIIHVCDKHRNDFNAIMEKARETFYYMLRDNEEFKENENK